MNTIKGLDPRRSDKRYTFYDTCDSYELDNSFLFDLIRRSKFKKYIIFVKKYLDNFVRHQKFVHDFDITLMHEKNMYKILKNEFSCDNLSQFIRLLQLKLGIDIEELTQYYTAVQSVKNYNNELRKLKWLKEKPTSNILLIKSAFNSSLKKYIHVKHKKAYKEVSSVQFMRDIYNDDGTTEKNISTSQQLLSLANPQSIIYLQDLLKPTIRLDRTMNIPIEININQNISSIIDYVKTVKEQHEASNFHKKLFTIIRQYSNYDFQTKERYTREHYSSLLYIYDRIKAKKKRVKTAILLKNITEELNLHRKKIKNPNSNEKVYIDKLEKVKKKKDNPFTAYRLNILNKEINILIHNLEELIEKKSF